MSQKVLSLMNVRNHEQLVFGSFDDLFLRGNLLFSMNISTGQCTKLLDAKLRFVRCHKNTTILVTIFNSVTNISPLSACFHMNINFSINSLDFCSNGQYVFIGDQNGGLGMFKTDSNLSNLSKIRRFLICPNSKIANISVRQASK